MSQGQQGWSEAGPAEGRPYETAEAGPSGLPRKSIRLLELSDDSDEAEINASLAFEEAERLEEREAGPDEPAEKKAKEAGPSEPTGKGKGK